MIKSFLKYISIFIIFSGSARAQDPSFSQFYSAPNLLNPALCGSFQGGLEASLNYRSQWTSVENGAGITNMNADIELHNMKAKWENGYLSPGLSFFSDKSGSAGLGTSGAALTLASGIYLGPLSALSLGLQAGYSQYSVNPASLQWGSQYVGGEYDPNAPAGVNSFKSASAYADFSAGLSYSYGSVPDMHTIGESQTKANIGLAVFHVNQPSIAYFVQSSSGARLDMRYVAHGMFSYRFNETKISLIPAFVFDFQGPSTQLNLGLKLRYAFLQKTRFTQMGNNCNLDLGAWYRLNDAVMILAGIQYGPYAVAISYDVTVSQFTNATSGMGAFELSFRYLNVDLFPMDDAQRHYAYYGGDNK